MQPVIDLKAVSFRHKNGHKTALKNIDLSVQKGEWVVIQGASGSGKTSLCHLLNGLIPQAVEGELTGEVHVCGKDASKFRAQTLAKEIGLVMQDPEVQIVGRTVYEDVAFGLRNFLVPKAEIEQRVPEVLRLAGLQGFEHRKSNELSGGEKQLLAIAGALVMQPDILVLDEPASELDPAGRDAVYRLFRELREKTKLTIVLIEPFIGDILNQIDRVVLLDDGQIAWTGSPDDFYDSKPLPESLEFEPARKRSMSATSIGEPRHRAPTNPQSIIELKDLHFGYDSNKPVLDRIKLKIFPDDYLAIVGHNGAGKTSLVKHFNGLIKPNLNQVFFNGRDVATLKKKKLMQSIGLVFQNPDHQLFESSVEKEIVFGLHNMDLNSGEVQTRVEKTLSDTGLSAVRGMHPYSLPRGIRQLIAIASIIALHPKLLVIDEPTTGLDRESVNMVMSLLDKLYQNGTAIVLISHDLGLVRRHSRRTVIMRDGRIVGDAPTMEIFSDSAALAKAALIPRTGDRRLF